MRLKERDKLMFFEGLDNDLNKFDKLMDDFEPEMRMPVLIKKYIKQNAKVISFNVDPNFNDAIDGLMYIRISDLPESTIKPVLEEMSEYYKNLGEKNVLIISNVIGLFKKVIKNLHGIYNVCTFASLKTTI